MDQYDVVVVGGGGAGLSAALVLARARRRVLVVDSGAPRNAPAEHMQGFLSRDGMSPADLLAEGRAEVVGYGGTLMSAVVKDVVRHGTADFEVLLASGGEHVAARRLLVATGLRDELPDIPGLAERWARDVLHCPYCHGWEVRDQRLGVIWNGPETVRYAQIVRQWSRDLVLFAPVDLLAPSQRSELAARAIRVVDDPIVRVLVEDDQLSGVRLLDGRVLPRDALFVPPRFVPNDGLLRRLGCAVDQQGWVVSGAHGATSVPGVWTAGNVTNPRAQVITAAGEGSAAAIAINAELVDDDVRDALAEENRSATLP